MINMSEKRLKFTLDSDRQYIGISNEGYAMTGFEVCNYLNSLYQQCEALHHAVVCTGRRRHTESEGR